MPGITTNDGVNLSYEERGSGPPLVLVPGWGMSTRWFEGQLAGLSDGARVVSYDPRGQGASDKVVAGQRMARLARDLEDVLEALDLRDVVLLGWSLGVSAVLAYVDVYGTDRLRQVVLVCGGPRLIKSADWELGFTDLEGAAAWRDLVAHDFDTAVSSVVPQFFAAPPAEADLAWMVAETAKCEPTAMSEVSWNVLNQDYRDVAAKIDKPTLVIGGRHDHVVPFGNAAWFADHIADARLAVFEDSAHCPFLEEPERFNDEVAAFMAQAVAR